MESVDVAQQQSHDPLFALTIAHLLCNFMSVPLFVLKNYRNHSSACFKGWLSNAAELLETFYVEDCLVHDGNTSLLLSELIVGNKLRVMSHCQSCEEVLLDRFLGHRVKTVGCWI